MNEFFVLNLILRSYSREFTSFFESLLTRIYMSLGDSFIPPSASAFMIHSFAGIRYVACGVWYTTYQALVYHIIGIPHSAYTPNGIGRRPKDIGHRPKVIGVTFLQRLTLNCDIFTTQLLR